MKLYINSCTVLLFIIVLTSCSNERRDLIEEAKSKFFMNNVSYITEAQFPVPETELVNKMHYETILNFNETNPLGYNYKLKKDDKVYVYQNNELKVINHKNKKNRIVLPKHFKDQKQFESVADNQLAFKKWSPIVLLKYDWEFLKDTLIENKELKNYRRITTDTVIEGKAVRTEQHIFLNSDAELTRFERRNYNNGIKSQVLVFNYTDYKFADTSNLIVYQPPADYTTQYGIPRKKELKQLEVGQKVPFFKAATMKGDSISTNDFKKKKYVLNFSVINCGNCKLTLDYMNQEDFIYNDKVPMIYINPEDYAEKMKIYMEGINVPFPVITEAKEIANNFGVNSYPRFFVIDERGIIEKIQIGYSAAFLDQFRE